MGQRCRWLLVGHLICFLLITVAFFPRVPENDELLSAKGQLSTFEVCNARSCRTGIALENIRFSCGADVLGPSLVCPDIKSGALGEVTWFRHRTLFGEENIATSIRANGKVIWAQSEDQIRKEALISALFSLTPILAISFYLISQIHYFKGK